MTEKTISGIGVWQDIEGEAIPGSARVPSDEIKALADSERNTN